MIENNYTIKYSDKDTESSIIYDLMDIERDVYEEKDRGHFDSIEKRFNNNKEMFILLYDVDKLIGYLCYFPISKELHDKILKAGDFYDDNIESKDVVEYSKENYIYLISIALYKKYHHQGLGQMMMDSFFDKLKEKKSSGHEIKDILASAISPQGEKILEKYNFKLIQNKINEYGYKLMHLEGDKVWKIQTSI